MDKPVLAAIALVVASMAATAIEVNQANDMELDSLRGIGPALSGRMLRERSSRGAFSDWNDLLARVKGLGPAQAARLSAQGMTVDGAPFEPAGKKTTATGNSATGTTAVGD